MALQPILARGKQLCALAGCNGETCVTLPADTALAVRGILQRHDKVHFWDDPDARNAAMNDIDDYLYDEVKKKTGLDLNDGQIDAIRERTMRIARHGART